MQAFTSLSARVAPMDRANVDTDLIIPKQFLKSIKRTGFGVHLFDSLRYLDEGEPGQDCSERPLNPEFVLNLPRYRDAGILLARENFGCGSSREHAPWALGEYGFRCIIAPSFADIFYSNCCANGILPVILPSENVERLFQELYAAEDYQLSVDLNTLKVRKQDGVEFSFEMEDARRQRMLKGLDEIGFSLENAQEIRAFEERRRREAPWIFAYSSA